jgi:hypothetical protein
MDEVSDLLNQLYELLADATINGPIDTDVREISAGDKALRFTTDKGDIWKLSIEKE